MVLKVEKFPKVVTIVALIAVNHWKELEETTQIILPIILPFIFLTLKSLAVKNVNG